MSNPDAARPGPLPPWDEQRKEWRDLCKEDPCQSARWGIAASMCRICVYEARVRACVINKMKKPFELV